MRGHQFPAAGQFGQDQSILPFDLPVAVFQDQVGSKVTRNVAEQGCVVNHVESRLRRLRVCQCGQEVVLHFVKADGVQDIRVALRKILLADGEAAGLCQLGIHAGEIFHQQCIQESPQDRFGFGSVDDGGLGGRQGGGLRPSGQQAAVATGAQEKQHQGEIDPSNRFHRYSFLLQSFPGVAKKVDSNCLTAEYAESAEMSHFFFQRILRSLR